MRYEISFQRIIDVGTFSPPLEQILVFLLKETESIKSESRKENEARKAELNAKIKEIDDRLNQETDRCLLFIFLLYVILYLRIPL